MDYRDLPEKKELLAEGQLHSAEKGWHEITRILADSVWKHEVLPTAQLLTSRVAHLFAQQAGTDALARISDDYDNYDWDKHLREMA